MVNKDRLAYEQGEQKGLKYKSYTLTNHSTEMIRKLV